MVLPLYDDNPFRLPVRPIVTWLLILTNILVFLVEMSGGDQDAQILANAFGVTPVALLGQSPDGLPPSVFTLVTYMFLHADIMHIFGNMIFLWVFGDDVEEALAAIRFLLFYLLCGVIGGVVFVASDPQFEGPLIGASGAISGVIVAYVMLRPCAKVDRAGLDHSAAGQRLLGASASSRSSSSVSLEVERQEQCRLLVPPRRHGGGCRAVSADAASGRATVRMRAWAARHRSTVGAPGRR